MVIFIIFKCADSPALAKKTTSIEISDTGNKNLGKFDNDNTDLEEDEDDYKWEIERDWSRKYYRRNDKKLNKKKGDKLQEICNHRKHYRFEGELLIMWNDGKREWSYMSSVFHDANSMVVDYIEKQEFSIHIMCFGMNFINPITGKTNKNLGEEQLASYLAVLQNRSQLKELTTKSARKKKATKPKTKTKYNKSWSVDRRNTRSNVNVSLVPNDEEIQDPSNDEIVSIHDEKQPIPEENVPPNKESVENEEVLPIPVEKGPNPEAVPEAVDVSIDLKKNGHECNEKIPIPVNGSENSGPNNLVEEKADHLKIKDKLPILGQVKENLPIPINVSDGPKSVDEEKATQVENKYKLPIPNNVSVNNGLEDEKTEHVQVNENLPIPEQVKENLPIPVNGSEKNGPNSVDEEKATQVKVNDKLQIEEKLPIPEQIVVPDVPVESPSTSVNTSLPTVEASNNDPSSVTEKTQTISKPEKVKPVKLPKIFLCREYDHKNKKNWVKMEDPRWCAVRCRFYNTYCNICHDFFVPSKPKEKDFKPSSRKPMYCCKNWTDNCQFALCYKCFVKEYKK